MVGLFAVRKSTSYNTICVDGVILDSKQRWNVTTGFLHDIESSFRGEMRSKIGRPSPLGAFYGGSRMVRRDAEIDHFSVTITQLASHLLAPSWP